MITAEILKNAYENGLLRFDNDPMGIKGKICKIGQHWFYFDTKTSMDESPEEFLKNADMDEILRKLSNTINSFEGNECFNDLYRYFYMYLKKHGTMDMQWAEIRCDYLDEENQFWSVDAWEYPFDHDGDGKTIAYIDDLSGRVIYTDPIARIDKDAQEVIQAKIKEVKAS